MEITVVLGIVSVLMMIVYSLIEETMRVTMFNESHNDLAILSQSAVNAMQGEVLQTRFAFQEDALGTSYRSALKLPKDVTVWGDSFLPIFATEGDIEPDSGPQRFTGNSLFLARQIEPDEDLFYDHDGKAGTPPVQFLADRYRFEYVYLARSDAKSFSGSGMTLDLLMSRSDAYADHFQLKSLPDDTVRGRVVKELIARGLTESWDPGQPVDTAFYTLADATDGTFGPPVKKPQIVMVRTRTLLRPYSGAVHESEQRLPGGGSISGRIDYSVAFGQFPIRTPVGVFAKYDAAEPGFPSGFEVKISGPARNRKVMTRLVVMSHYGATKYESQQAFVITAARF